MESEKEQQIQKDFELLVQKLLEDLLNETEEKNGNSIEPT